MRAPLPQVIATARLRLRPFADDDGPGVLAAMSNLDVSGWLSSVPHPYAKADFGHFLKNIAHPGAVFAIYDLGGFVGAIGLNDEFGYWLAPQAQGKGYATEAARAVLGAFFTTGATDVVSGYFDGNDRSARVLVKLGFVETGRAPKFCKARAAVRAHVGVALTRAEFTACYPHAAQSARLQFRDLQPFDVDDLHELVSDWLVVRQLGSYPWPSDPAFTASRSVPYAGEGFAWGVFNAGALIGTVAVTKGALGYMIAPPHWRQGFAAEACQLALNHAFKTLPLDHITAGVWADNHASCGLLAKLGFTVTAQTHDMSKARGVMADGFDMRLARKDWAATSGA